MITLIFIIFIGIFIFSSHMEEETYEEAWSVIKAISCVISVIALITLIAMIFVTICNGKIDQKIVLYEEKNKEIEENISELVKSYMNYEKDTFDSVSSSSAMTLVSLYPELKSDALVENQCNLYIENNKKITELKEDEIDLSTIKWWLYFGGIEEQK